MDLKLTTKRALEFENKTGKDLLVFLQEVANAGAMSVKDTIDLFAAMGENYTVDVFDEWDEPFTEKIVQMMSAVEEYYKGKK